MSRYHGSLRRHLTAFLVAALMGAPGALAAPPTPGASPTADEIVARYVEVRGGIQKLRALKSLRQEGRVNAGAGRVGLVTREIKRPGKVRFELTVQGVTSVFATDGQRGWKVDPLGGEMSPQPLTDDAMSDASEQAEIDGPLVDWKSKGSQLELVGRATVDGEDAYQLKVTLRSGSALIAYVGVKTAHLVRTDAIRQVRGKDVRIETTFSDYRRIGGILFPHPVVVRAAGRPQVLRVVVEKIQVNPTLLDARFAPPA